jgi:hypothetical protein
MLCGPFPHLTVTTHSHVWCARQTAHGCRWPPTDVCDVQATSPRSLHTVQWRTYKLALHDRMHLLPDQHHSDCFEIYTQRCIRIRACCYVRDAMAWNGMRWDRTGWDGAGREGVGCDGTGWDRKGWDGAGRD